MTATTERSVKGLLGEKLGMTQVWDADNKLVPVTVVQAGPCVVTQVRDEATDGYAAVQIAYGAIDPRKVNKPEAGHFAKAGVTPRRHVVQIRTDWLNRRSQAAIERLGAKRDGVLRSHQLKDGRVRDLVVYSIIAGEWPSVRANLEYLLARDS